MKNSRRVSIVLVAACLMLILGALCFPAQNALAATPYNVVPTFSFPKPLNFLAGSFEGLNTGNQLYSKLVYGSPTLDSTVTRSTSWSTYPVQNTTANLNNEQSWRIEISTPTIYGIAAAANGSLVAELNGSTGSLRTLQGKTLLYPLHHPM